MGAQAVRLNGGDIDIAFRTGQIMLATQPVICLRTNELYRYQTIARWQHPRKGILSPEVTTATFAGAGAGSQLTRHVLERLLIGARLDGFCETDGLGVTLSPADLLDASFPAAVAAMLKAASWAPEHLTLECPAQDTEMAPGALAAAVRRLALVGCPLSLRTNGRLTDGLKALDPFPFSEIRADGTPFLRRLRANSGTRTERPLTELLAFAEAREVAVVAGGIDDYRSAGRSRELGFEAAQGSVLGGPRALSAPSPAAPPQGDVPFTIEETPRQTEDDEIELGEADPVSGVANLPVPAEGSVRALQAQLQRDFICLGATPGEASETEHPADHLDRFVAALPLLPLDTADRFDVAEVEPDADRDASLRSGPAPKRTRPRANILTRKYKVTHFWPRSWTAAS